MTVYLVGAGPGAPDLLTLRAARLLEQADIVFYDALVHPDTIALATQAQKFPVGKRCGKHSTAQQFINKRLVDAAKRYGVVVRLKGGDPMMFGRAQEEIAALEEAGIACEVVPGITAALAAAAQIKTSLTQRGSARSITFATPRVGASEPDSTWDRRARGSGRRRHLHGRGRGPRLIAQALIASGKPPGLPVAVVESASLPEQRIRYTTLADLPRSRKATITGPALILLGRNSRARANELARAMYAARSAPRRRDVACRAKGRLERPFLEHTYIQ
jgi:uroporphyrin-III C-methyltransferase